jgi:hypothetical protein
MEKFSQNYEITACKPLGVVANTAILGSVEKCLLACRSGILRPSVLLKTVAVSYLG